MSSRTKIIVIHMKNIIFSGILIGIIILALLIVFLNFSSKKNSSPSSVATSAYIPGVYSSSVNLNDTAIDVQVTVDDNHINSVSLVNMSKSVETMYPLIEPAMKELSKQIVKNQTLDGITYSKNNQYTSMVLIDAIENALSKAQNKK